MAKDAWIDKDLKVETQFDTANLDFYYPIDAPFTLYGITPPSETQDRYRRLPESVVNATDSAGLKWHGANGSGARVKFRTNSKTISIIAVLDKIGGLSHMPNTGVCGFDLYVDDRYFSNFIPPFWIRTEGNAYSSQKNITEYIFDGEEIKEREITIYFPLYCDVISLKIGIEKGATLNKTNGYKNKTPIVFYGHSITQGGCVSHPGNSHSNILTRRLNVDCINFGFSGSAKGEKEVCEYVINRDMCAFIYEYDHNSLPEELAKRHKPFFDRFREKHPLVPVIISPTTDCEPTIALRKQRFDVCYATYKSAIDNGDKNVYFLDAYTEIRKRCGDYAFVEREGGHLNDVGALAMADMLEEILTKIIKF